MFPKSTPICLLISAVRVLFRIHIPVSYCWRDHTCGIRAVKARSSVGESAMASPLHPLMWHSARLLLGSDISAKEMDQGFCKCSEMAACSGYKMANGMCSIFTNRASCSAYPVSDGCSFTVTAVATGTSPPTPALHLFPHLFPRLPLHLSLHLHLPHTQPKVSENPR